MSDDLPPFVDHLVGFYAILLLQVGRQSGLLDAVLSGGGSAAEIAARAGADERNTAEWLRGLTAAGYLAHDAGVFAPTEMTTMTFSPGFPIQVPTMLDALWASPQVYGDVVAAVRSGDGIGAERLEPYGLFVGVGTPTYEQALVGDWVAAVPGLAARLGAGAQVAEIAPGNGAAAAILGRAFPASVIVGYDLNPQQSADLPANVTLRRADARDLPEDGPFDFVYCLDSLHHISDAGTLLTSVRRAMRPGGVVLVAENDLTGDLDQDATNPTAVIAFTSSVFYCLQEALHGGGEVHSCAEGTRWVEDAMSAAGFQDVAVHHSETGYAIISGLA